MPTLKSIKDKIQSLLNSINSKTGKSDSTLTAGVASLMSGYGQNSGSDIPTGLTAKATQVLEGETFIGLDRFKQTGTMTDNGTVIVTLNSTTPSYTIPIGYHSGSGKVNMEDGYIKPSGAYPTVIKNNGTYTVTKYETVIVEVPTNIPSGYYDTSGVTATAATVLSPYKFVNKTGESVEGIIPNNGAVSVTLDASSPSYVIPVGYHNGSGTVSIGEGVIPKDYLGNVVKTST